MSQPSTHSMVIVTAPHEQSHADPIKFSRGAVVEVGRRDNSWPEWFWCRSADGREGWVHESFFKVEVDGERAVTLRDFDAIELSVQPGEALRCIERVGGWAWCMNARGHSGWVPETSFQTKED